MLRLANSGQPIRVVEDFVASPTYAPELALRTADLVDRKIEAIFHVGGGAAISWFEYAKLIFEVAGITPELRPSNEREHRTRHDVQILCFIERQDGTMWAYTYAAHARSSARLYEPAQHDVSAV